MMPPRSKITALTLPMISLLFFSTGAGAQMSNQPFSFGNAGRGAGMSAGGREAIINEKIQGIRPDNLVRGAGGELLDVQKGPGGSAITTYPGTGQFIPQYRGTGFQQYHPEMAAGIFNGFFLPTVLASSYAYSFPSSMYSGATVSTWTARVISGGMPISYRDDNVVDNWTGQTFIMDADVKRRP